MSGKRQSNFDASASSSKMAKMDLQTTSSSKIAKMDLQTTSPGKENVPSSSKGKGKAKSIAPTDGPQKPKRCQPKTVDKRLKSLNIDPERVSKCVKAAMCKGHIVFNGDKKDLDQLIIEESYRDHRYKIYLKDVLYQEDYGGDYEDGSEGASAECICCKDGDEDNEDNEWPGKAYVTRLCEGQPELSDGKFHNHCGECKGFGQCIGDYRMAHCGKCNKHWFQGNLGFKCDNCKRKRQRERMSALKKVPPGLAGLGALAMMVNMMQDSDHEGYSDSEDEDDW